MNRKKFLQQIGTFSLAAYTMNTQAFNTFTNSLKPSAKMPVLFVGHGSPMNAIESNEFTKKWQQLGVSLPKPQAILCISAHWETEGTFVTAMAKPKTIHDFGGFPQALFDVQYPAPGSIDLATNTKAMIKQTTIGLDEKWGLDHGCWSILKPMFPKADIPVIQMSLDYRKDASYHYNLGKELQELRHKGVLIIGSGNIVHNLGLINWQKMNEPEYGFDWALEAKEKLNNFITSGNHQQLIQYKSLGKSVALAVPSPDHFLPLLYTLALKTEKDQLSLFNDKALMGSITMTSVMIN
jgi:4,5-DOPA dioxygenase extradiol